VDLFSDWERGIAKLIRAMRREANRRQQRLELAG
jgi:uncharacterized protein YjiS (DUF1127 family)